MERIIDYWSDGKPTSYELSIAITIAQEQNIVVRITWESPYYEHDGSIYQVILHSYTTIATAENSIKKIKIEEV